ncbi:MAG: hypothetical protein JNK21_16575 [Rhodospirillaceae bacterium]|nr:hypothetical protein [Rhodospirillaceae bacterium]
MNQRADQRLHTAWRGIAAALALALLAACAGGPAPQQPAAQQVAKAEPKPGDGIGGTGISNQPKVVARTRGADGIGGTGILGTISGFGSIIVNGLELEYDRDTAVETDGAPGALEDLKVGQVVQGVARMKGSKMYLDTLEMQHAVTGPIESIDHAKETLTVLGQKVRANLSGDKAAIESFKTLAKGDMVSISGLRQADGTIIATRIDQQPADGRIIVRGLAVVEGATVKIGGLVIPPSAATASPAVANGARVFASGKMVNGAFVPDVVVSSGVLPFDDAVRDVSIEAYAPNTGSSPLVIEGITIEGAVLPTGTAEGDRVVITGRVSGADRVSATTIEKIRTFVTILKARGSLRPASIRPDNNSRPERIAPPPRPERPTPPTRPERERPEGGPMV